MTTIKTTTERTFAASTFTKEQYYSSNSLVELWWKDPHRVDLGECLYYPIVPFIPHCIHPNHISFICLIFGILLFVASCFVPYYYMQQDYEQCAVLCLICAFCNFMTMTLDCLDGLHARATKQCSYLGALLDHWFDSIGVATNTCAMTFVNQCNPMMTVIGVSTMILIFNEQLLVHCYTDENPRIIGVEGQIGATLVFILISALYTFESFHIIWLICAVSLFLCLATLVHFMFLFSKNFSKQMYLQFFIVFANLTSISMVYYLKYISKFEFCLVCIAIGNRYNGSLVLHQVGKQVCKTFDLYVVLGCIAIFIEHWVFRSSAKLGIMEFEKDNDNYYGLHWSCIGLFLFMMYKNLSEFNKFFKIVVARDRKKK